MADPNVRAILAHAVAAYEGHDYRAAADLCRQTLHLERNNVTALTLAAAVAGATDRPSEELDYLTKAARADPKNPQIRERLGHSFKMSGAYSKSLAQFEKALKLDPKLLGAAAGIAEVYEFQNKSDRARRFLKPFTAGRPDASVYRVLLRVLVNDGDLDGAIEHGERMLAAGLDESIPLRDACLQLALAYERSGNFDLAFARAEMANKMFAPAYDSDLYRQTTDATIEAFSRERLEAAPRPRQHSEVPIFIVGTPRCGSTLVERIIDSHPAVHGAGELRIVPSLLRDISLKIDSDKAYPQCVEDLTEDSVENLAATYLDELVKLAPRAERIADKDLGNFQRLGFLSIILPGSRVIHVHRDPLDTCLSIYMLPFGPIASPFSCDLGHLGIFYRQYERLMQHWRETVDIPILDVRYEELVADQDAMTRRIIDFCGVPWDDACLRFHETKRQDRTFSYDQVRRPIYTSSIGRAERFGAHLDPLRAALDSK